MKPLPIIFGIIAFATIALALRATEQSSTQASIAATTRAAASAPAEEITFATVDIVIDSKDQKLAAYQFEFAAETGDAKLIGIEGGTAPAFAKIPPYYDPAALQQHRVIIAAYSTDDAVPTGKTRVVRLHMAIYGDAKPHYAVKLEAAASPDGKPILSQATISILEGAAP